MAHSDQPFNQMNTTPLIDVLLVLLIMFIMSVPIAAHSIEVDLPSCNDCPVPDLEPLRNKIVIDAGDRILWNGEPVSREQLQVLLSATADLSVEPETQFEPDARASYDTVAKTLQQIKASGITKFGFVGNERYRDF